jgi:ribosomal protein S18 acetylase RimI-like enzyme
MPPSNEAVLENPAYAALCGPHARFARVSGRVRRYEEDVAPFLALPSSPSTEDWRDAAALLAPATPVAIRGDGADLPDGWRVLQTFELVQMVGERVTGADCSEATLLGPADVPEMLELVAQTEPGPFLSRTIELGDYLGIRRDGALAAMAGERFRPDGWTEVSAICTAPEYRGQGLASKLVGALVANIERRSEGVFLHALDTNVTAIRLYEQLGFRVSRTATIAVVAYER